MNPEASSYQHGLLCQLFVMNILKKSWIELSWFNNHQKVINFGNTTRILQAWWKIKGVKSVLFKKYNQKQLQTSESYFLTRMIQHNFKEQEMIQCKLTSKMNVSKKMKYPFISLLRFKILLWILTLIILLNCVRFSLTFHGPIAVGGSGFARFQ